MLSNLNAKPQCIQQLLSNNLFFIPNYQRLYTWDVGECESLWNDLMANYESEDGEVLSRFYCFDTIRARQKLL